MVSLDTAFLQSVSWPEIFLFLFAVIFTFVFGSVLNFVLIKYLRQKTRPDVYKPVSKLVMYTVYALGFYFSFQRILHFNLPAGLAALGVLGIALLLPTVPILQNIAAGIVLSFERPFREEDGGEVSGTLCKVKDIMLRKTRFRSMDGKIITLPNLSFITGTPIINYSRGEFIKIVLVIDIAPDSDRNKAMDIIKQICTDNPNILPNVPEKKLNMVRRFLEVPKNFFTIPRNIKSLNPQVTIQNVTKDKIGIEVWFWTWDILMKEKIVSAFYSRLIEEFSKAGIKFG